MKQEIINHFTATLIYELEGAYEENVQHDRGGRTRYGITKREIIEAGEDWGKVDINFAFDWFEHRYFRAANLHRLDSEPLAWRLFVDGVHIGATMPIEFLQRLLNAFNLGQRRWSDIEVDGVLGNDTLHALVMYKANQSINDRGLGALHELLRAITANYYLQIVENDETQEVFFLGWTNRLSKFPAPIHVGEGVKHA